MPRELIDQAKALAHQKTGIPIDRMLIAEQRETCERLEQSLASQLASLDAAEPEAEQAFSHLVMELRLAQTRAAIEWLERAAAS